MSADELSGSEVYIQPNVLFEKSKKYLISASSGHGKTSILNFIYGSSVNFEGRILYDGRVPELTLKENILLKNNLTGHKSITQIEEWVDRVGLSHRLNTKVKTLSLGQRQRTAVLRALCQPFDFLLMDEPFSHLDDENIKVLCDIISAEVESQGASLILTSLGGKNYFNYHKILNL